ncbi:dipeptidase [Leptospira interrogans]
MFIDGLVVAKPSRTLFENMHKGGLTAANFTCSIWEGLEDTIVNIADWKEMLRENADILCQIRSVDDIIKARDSGKVGIILGWQNSTGFGDYLPNVRLFHELGLRVVQLTYNGANSSGGGCYESVDGGLTDFGRELIAEMNDVGILIDLSHVGAKTSDDVIKASRKPVAYTHCCPLSLHKHFRNKSDEQLRTIVEHGGFVGVAAVPHFLPKGSQTTVEDFADVVAYVVNLLGEENVGIGTDLVEGQPMEFFDWISRDKGTGRSVTTISEFPVIRGFEQADRYPNIVAGLKRRFSDSQVEKITSGNWIRFLSQVW